MRDSCCDQTFDIADDTDGGEVVAIDIVALHFYDINLIGILQCWTGQLADTAKADGATPIAEKESCVATIIDKQRTIWITGLWLDDEQQVTFFALFDAIHIEILRFLNHLRNKAPSGAEA